MGKTVLFVDYTHQKGHINFNRIHIDALKDEGYNVKIVTNKEFAPLMGYQPSDYVLLLSEYPFKGYNSPIINRIFYIISLLYIKIMIRTKNYDHIIVSSCDEITLGLIPLGKKMNIICHKNADGFNNKIKKYMLRKLACNNVFIVLNELSAKTFKTNGIDNVHIISHGCVKPFSNIKSVKLPINISQYDKIIFHPSSKSDGAFISEITQNKKLAKLLNEKNILLVIHDKSASKTSPNYNIQYITEYLSDEQYKYLFMMADIILLAYPDTFRYQVSGISFECVANKKNMLIRDNKALDYCRSYYNYDPLFSDIDEFCDKIKKIIGDKELKCIASAESLKPDYTKILK